MFGAVIPVRRGQWRFLKELAQAGEAAGWEYIFSDEGPGAGGNDSVMAAFFSAVATRQIHVGTSIAIISLRQPYLFASTAAILQEVTGGRFIMGLGVSHPSLLEPIGIPWENPAAAMRRYVADIRHYSEGHSPTPIWLAVTRLAMAKLGGEIGDGVNIFGTPYSLFPKTIETVREGERLAEKPRPTFVAGYARIAMDDDLRVARSAARAAHRFYCSLPAYQQLYSMAGWADEIAHFRRSLEHGDEAGMDRALTDNFLDDTHILGPKKRCLEQLEKLRASGVDALLFSPVPIDGDDLPTLFRPVIRNLRLPPSRRLN